MRENILKTLKFKHENVALIIEGEKLQVNKDELMLISPVFQRMLNSDFLEKDQSEIKFPGKKLLSFTCFLKCALPGATEGVTGTVFVINISCIFK